MNKGLKIKYNVYKVSDNSIVYDCFVLRPDKDPAAVAALMAYGQATDNKALADDIYQWVDYLKSDPAKFSCETCKYSGWESMGAVAECNVCENGSNYSPAGKPCTSDE